MYNIAKDYRKLNVYMNIITSRVDNYYQLLITYIHDKQIQQLVIAALT